MNNILKLVVSFAVCFAAAVAGALVTNTKTPSWYAGLRKPSFQPPDWLFGPAWTVLYILMALALFLVWRHVSSTSLVRTAVFLFLAKLILNVLWSILFFGLRRPGLGLVEIVVLWVAILLTLLTFLRASTLAGILLVPYLAWVSFATVLNAAIVRLNR